jgi:hypothetical protein
MVTDYVYVIEAEGLKRVKVGRAKNPGQRLGILQLGSPVRLTLVKAYGLKHAGQIERAVHWQLQDKLVWGEWFEVSASEAEMAIRIEAAKRGMGALEVWVKPQRAPKHAAHILSQPARSKVIYA